MLDAMVANNVDHVFFTSGTEISFYQEAIAKQVATKKANIRLISVLHEHACLNAALGYSAVSGKPTVTAVHVDVGTLHHGGAIHTASRSGLPVLMTAGAPPTAYSGTTKGSRDAAHFWLQEVYDQNAIVRQYVKWEHRLVSHENPGLVVSRALQVAMSEPAGPAYLCLPREIVSTQIDGCQFPTSKELGIGELAGLDAAQIDEIARVLLAARNPIVVSGQGKNPVHVAALVGLCELLGMPATEAASKSYQCFPMDHALFFSNANLSEYDVVLVLDAAVPWNVGSAAPSPTAKIIVIDADPVKMQTPLFEFEAAARITGSAHKATVALTERISSLLDKAGRALISERFKRNADASAQKRNKLDSEAKALSQKSPIDWRWVSHQIGSFCGNNAIVVDDMTHNRLAPYLRLSQPGSYFHNPGSSGGWAPGFALGAKLAAPDRDVVAVTGDGFYGFSTANAALWSAKHVGAPFITVIYQNRSYSTGTVGTAAVYPDGYASKSGYEGGFFDPPIDYAMEAIAAGAYGETVTQPEQILPALERGREAVRAGKPAVISVWLPKLLHNS
ncbi:MAG: thiamine pyrophosphate-binding protein [Afipia sp.]|nr:thiamine pyrophosphate-binding protein [Afipia sp.]